MMNIVQQTAGSIGTATMSVILTNQIQSSRAASDFYQVITGSLDPAKVTAGAMAAGRAALAGAFGNTYAVAFVLIVACLIPAFFLPRRKSVGVTDDAGEQQPQVMAMH